MNLRSERSVVLRDGFELLFKKVRIDGLEESVTDRKIWTPRPGSTLILVFAFIKCVRQEGVVGLVNEFELEVDNTDVVATVAAPNQRGKKERLVIASQTSFTQELPLTFTQTDVGVGDELKQDLYLYALKL